MSVMFKEEQRGQQGWSRAGEGDTGGATQTGDAGPDRVVSSQDMKGL